MFVLWIFYQISYETLEIQREGNVQYIIGTVVTGCVGGGRASWQV